jgi:hypothetical protein
MMRFLLSLIAILVLTCSLTFAQTDTTVVWNSNATEMSVVIDGETVSFPQLMFRDDFPEPDTGPDATIDKTWPVFTYHLRWSASTLDWPEESRDNALDYILMRACNINAYARLYHETVISARITYPPQFVAEAMDVNAVSLTGILRGQTIEYEMLTSGGFGAPDALIETALAIGASRNGKTIFYSDESQMIDENLDKRTVIFAAHDAGDRINFELWGEYVAKDRALFRGEAMNRLERANVYLANEMVRYLDDAPTAEEIEKYNATIAAGSRTIPDGDDLDGDGVSDADTPPAVTWLSVDDDAGPLKPTPAPGQDPRWLLITIATAVALVGLVTLRAVIKRRYGPKG